MLAHVMAIAFVSGSSCLAVNMFIEIGFLMLWPVEGEGIDLEPLIVHCILPATERILRDTPHKMQGFVIVGIALKSR